MRRFCRLWFVVGCGAAIQMAFYAWADSMWGHHDWVGVVGLVLNLVLSLCGWWGFVVKAGLDD